jgi:hypothetical protein
MHGFISFAFLAVLGTWPVYAQEQTRGRSERLKDRSAHEILIADRYWYLLGEGYHLTADSTVDKVGNVYFTDASKNRILKIDLDGNINTWRKIPTAHTASLSARMAACMRGSTTGRGLSLSRATAQNQ